VAPQNPDRPELLIGVQVMRGLAAMLVVISHANTMMSHREFFGASPLSIIDFGAFGVALFFIVSGFIIAYVSLDDDLTPRLSASSFARRRFMRIVPFMWICIIGYNVLAAIGTGVIEWAPMMRAMVLFPIGELKPNVLWSLVHEWIFYALFAVAYFGIRARSFLYAWFAAPIWWAALRLLSRDAVVPANPQLAELCRVLFQGNLFGANLQFAVGYVLAMLLLHRSPLLEPKRWSSVGLLIVVTFGTAILVETLALQEGLVRSLVWTALAAPTALLAIVCNARPGILTRVGRILGDASFSIYLVHNPALLILFRIAKKLPELPLILLYLPFVAGATIAGIAVHYWIEAPLVDRLAHGRKVAPWLRRARNRI